VGQLLFLCLSVCYAPLPITKSHQAVPAKIV
jgi:hypothetical protein